jgi:peroxiredoxin
MTGIAEPRPAAFVLDEDRTIGYAWVASEWPEFPDYDELESALESVTDS